MNPLEGFFYSEEAGKPVGYTPNQWRDRSIVAQVAAKCATELLRDRDGLEPEVFDAWAKGVFDTIWGLAGEPPPPSASEAAEPSQAASNAVGSGSRPNANFKLKFGKHKGMTLAEIANTVDNRGEPGSGYLRWLLTNSDDKYLTEKISEFLG